MERKLYKFAVLTSVTGLLLIAVIIITGTAYPDLLFQVLTPIGLLLIIVSLGLFVLAWIFSIKKEIKSKNYLYAAVLLLVGILFVVRMMAHS